MGESLCNLRISSVDFAAISRIKQIDNQLLIIQTIDDPVFSDAQTKKALVLMSFHLLDVSRIG